MPNFTVYFEGHADAYVRVEAEDISEAIDKAYDQVPYGVCAQCSGYGQNWGLDISDEMTASSVRDNATDEEYDVTGEKPTKI